MKHDSLFSTFCPKITCLVVIASFVMQITFPSSSFSEILNSSPAMNFPQVGSLVNLSDVYQPAMMRGMQIFPENPFRFDFIVDTGDSGLDEKTLKDEADRLIRYFYASLTVPEQDLWVNLSPYENDRIVPESFGVTEMGRDLLAQDYLLKQITASLMYPEGETGRKFWERVYQKANELYGTTDVPLDTFNKVWIIPDQAGIYVEDDKVFVVDAHLKVMLEEDYIAMSQSDNVHMSEDQKAKQERLKLMKNVVREVMIPEIEREVNEGKNFATLRQIYNAVILSTWFKRNLKEGLAGYIDQNKTSGIEIDDKTVKQVIYDRYVEAFRKGVYNMIKEEYDPITQNIIPKKYFSGGAKLAVSDAMLATENFVTAQNVFAGNRSFIVQAGANMINPLGAVQSADGAMLDVEVIKAKLAQPDIIAELDKILPIEPRIAEQMNQPIEIISSDKFMLEEERIRSEYANLIRDLENPDYETSNQGVYKKEWFSDNGVEDVDGFFTKLKELSLGIIVEDGRAIKINDVNTLKNSFEDLLQDTPFKKHRFRIQEVLESSLFDLLANELDDQLPGYMSFVLEDGGTRIRFMNRQEFERREAKSGSVRRIEAQASLHKNLWSYSVGDSVQVQSAGGALPGIVLKVNEHGRILTVVDLAKGEILIWNGAIITKSSTQFDLREVMNKDVSSQPDSLTEEKQIKKWFFSGDGVTEEMAEEAKDVYQQNEEILLLLAKALKSIREKHFVDPTHYLGLQIDEMIQSLQNGRFDNFLFISKDKANIEDRVFLAGVHEDPSIRKLFFVEGFLENVIKVDKLLEMIILAGLLKLNGQNFTLFLREKYKDSFENYRTALDHAAKKIANAAMMNVPQMIQLAFLAVLMYAMNPKAQILESVTQTEDFTKGGIDLNPNMLKLDEKGDSSQMMMKPLTNQLNKDFIGVVPFIIDIKPLNMSTYLTGKSSEKPADTAQSHPAQTAFLKE